MSSNITELDDLSNFFYVNTPYIPEYNKPEVPDFSSSSQEGSSSKKSSSDDNGLSQKDLLKMLEDIDGLPNEMQRIVGNLQQLFSLYDDNISTGQLTNLYLQSIYDLRVAKQNKEKFDDASKRAHENGSWEEIAITNDGRIAAQDKNGNFNLITLEELRESDGEYYPLTTSQVALYRAQEPSFVNNDTLLNIMYSGMSGQKMNELLNDADIKIGSEETSYTTRAGVQEGKDVFESFTPEEKAAFLQGDIESITQHSKSNIQAIQSYFNYLASILPTQARVWAQYVTGADTQAEGIAQILGYYLTGQQDILNEYSVKYKNNKSSSGSSSDSSGDDISVSDLDLKSTSLRSFVLGLGQEESININPGGNTSICVNGRKGTYTDSQEHEIGPFTSFKNLYNSAYSRVLDLNHATLNGIGINKDAINYIYVKDNQIWSVEVPVDNNGNPDINSNIYKKTLEADKEIKNTGIDLSNQNEIIKNYKVISEIYAKHEVPNKYKQDGTLANHYKRFAIMNVYATDKAIGDFDGDFLGRELSDEETQNVINSIGDEQLSDEWDYDNWYDWNGHDTMYETILWIPMDKNFTNAFVGENSKISELQEINARLQANEIRKDMNYLDMR